MRCINYLSEYLVPVVLFYIVGFAVLQKRWLESCRRWWD